MRLKFFLYFQPLFFFAGGSTTTSHGRSLELYKGTFLELPLGNFQRFLTPLQVNEYLETVVKANGEVSSKVKVGETFEGRPINAICIGLCHSNASAVPKSFFNAMHHAREPEGLMAVMVFIEKIFRVLSVETDQRKDDYFEVNNLLNTRQLWLLPILNVDGYEYNINQSKQKLQRKNRRPTCSTDPNRGGVDLDRNYEICFDEPGIGSSTDGCAEDYRGEFALSEPETRAIHDFVIRQNFTNVLNIHSYGKDILIPYSCESLNNRKVNSFEKSRQEYITSFAFRIGEDTSYTVGKSFDPKVGLYPVNGDFADWLFSEMNCYALSIEVGGSGFYPSPGEIMELTIEPVKLMFRAAHLSGPYVNIKSVKERKLKGSFGVNFEVDLVNEGAWPTFGDCVSFSVCTLSKDITFCAESQNLPSINGINSIVSLSSTVVFNSDVVVDNVKIFVDDNAHCVLFILDKLLNVEKVIRRDCFAVNHSSFHSVHHEQGLSDWSLLMNFILAVFFLFVCWLSFFVCNKMKMNRKPPSDIEERDPILTKV